MRPAAPGDVTSYLLGYTQARVCFMIQPAQPIYLPYTTVGAFTSLHVDLALVERLNAERQGFPTRSYPGLISIARRPARDWKVWGVNARQCNS
jgi:hypothetical protein